MKIVSNHDMLILASFGPCGLPKLRSPSASHKFVLSTGSHVIVQYRNSVIPLFYVSPYVYNLHRLVLHSLDFNITSDLLLINTCAVL